MPSKRKLTPEQREKAKAYCREWYRRNKERQQAYFREWHRANRQTVRENKLRYFYGMTLAEWESLHQKQAGRCAICLEVLKPGNATAVDHDHKTGQVRGLLCSLCNKGLGQFRDSPELLLMAVNYLDRTKKG